MRIRRRFAGAISALALCSVVVLAGCQSAPGAAANTPLAAEVICERLYFGRTIPGGGEVSDADWASFVDTEVIPRFPAGFTVYHAEGYWRGASDRTEREASFVLEIIGPDASAAGDPVAAIAAAYRTRFRQEAVMRVRGPVAQSFLAR